MTRNGATAASLGLGAALALLLAGFGADAQTLRPPYPSGGPVVVGTERPNVFVDQSVLDALGPSPTLPQLLKGPTRGQKVTLHPPAARPQAASASPPKAPAIAQPAAPASPAPSATATPPAASP